jgi:Protein of unknown function (DUF429)
VATIKRADTRAVVRDVSRPADNDSVMSVIEEADKTGIDCPFGWPDAFVRFVATHHCGWADMPGSGISAGWQQELTMRRTDAFVHDKLGIMALGVSADKLADRPAPVKSATQLTTRGGSGRSISARVRLLERLGWGPDPIRNREAPRCGGA